MKIHELLKRNAILFPSKIFLYTEEESITYGRAWEEVQRASSGLDSMGVGIGDRVEFFAGDSIRESCNKCSNWAKVRADQIVLAFLFLKSKYSS
jgi:long-subunit acyl-CoA synthetase (AMP-forming)